MATNKAGIDTSVFKAHSTRGAATTAAANTGITTEDILKVADWSSDTVFSFIISRLRMPGLGKLYLPHKRSNSYKLPQLICETEPYKI